MCGIAGLVDFSGAPVDPGLVDAMADSVKHRGPDGRGVWSSSARNVALVHRRLAVIDLSPEASQPMANDGCEALGRPPLRIVFNGEIYNFNELRADLTARGHQFRTRSDTEAILHLYEEYGPDCVRHLRGMFAFVIWDPAERRCFAARDRAGKKPLYYRHDGQRFWFASEPRAILRDARVPAAISAPAIDAYLTLGYVPGAMSAYEGLERLLPAHCLYADANGVRTWRYWRLDYSRKLKIDEDEAAAELKRLLAESVRLRLISDVPLGAFLSGGIDSSLVVAAMASEAGSRIRTFSIGFDDPRFNELPLARQVAEKFGTEHQELMVPPAQADLLPRLAGVYGEPFADSSAVPTYILAGMTRRHITVALNGDGGDESFAGYTRYWAHLRALQYGQLPRVVRAPLERAAAAMITPRSGRTLSYDVSRFLSSSTVPAALRYAGWFGFFPDRAMRTPELASAVRGIDPIAALEHAFDPALHPIDAAMAADVDTYLPGDLLVKIDTATMAHGLEARSPLLDHHIMEFAAALPVHMKRRGRRGKLLLRRLAAEWLPPDILRAPKRGFGVPLDTWFRGEMRPLLMDLLGDRRARVTSYLRADVVQRLLDDHLAGRAAHGHRLWSLVMLELWHRICLEQRGAAIAPASAYV